ncbi:MAG: hypothetical protein LPK19_02735, partial [Hymenobacteraceae bacterium]|nr:hypothetical protein [Hymenobacteraceae bacterium]MDX5395100.1 hypothetical protein [Hymenobacteraceae bacterium]MDX5511138.1 hypothetical protein [Hymenobacteraceae bacterium]
PNAKEGICFRITELAFILCSIAEVVRRFLLSYFFLEKKVSKKSSGTSRGTRELNKLADRSDSISSIWHYATCCFS